MNFENSQRNDKSKITQWNSRIIWNSVTGSSVKRELFIELWLNQRKITSTIYSYAETEWWIAKKD